MCCSGLKTLAFPWPLRLQVPRSSQHIAEDNDYALMSVVLFKRVVDDFKAAARSKGYQVRLRQQQLLQQQGFAQRLGRGKDYARLLQAQFCPSAGGAVCMQLAVLAVWNISVWNEHEKQEPVCLCRA